MSSKTLQLSSTLTTHVLNKTCIKLSYVYVNYVMCYVLSGFVGGVLVRNPGNPHVYWCYTLGTLKNQGDYSKRARVSHPGPLYPNSLSPACCLFSKTKGPLWVPNTTPTFFVSLGYCPPKVGIDQGWDPLLAYQITALEYT